MLFVIFLISLGVFCGATKDGEKAPRIKLNNGHEIPHLGLGTFLGFDDKGEVQPTGTVVEDAVATALQSGYRLIDTAALYRDEDQVGRGVAKSGVDRKDVFVVTKIGSEQKRNVTLALKNSLTRLNMDYVDLYLIHFPISFKPDHSGYDDIDYLDTWKAMEEVQRLGLAKSIGISNFNISQIQRILDNCQIKPAVLQVEVNLNLAQDDLINYCKSKDIVVMAYSPFGSLFDKDTQPPPPRANDPVLVGLSEKYHKTVPQIVLRYLIQKGVVPIPKSVNKNRIEQNINVFDFELTQQEMDTLAKFNKNYRIVYPTYWQDAPYYPFEKTDQPRPNPFKGELKSKN